MRTYSIAKSLLLTCALILPVAANQALAESALKQKLREQQEKAAKITSEKVEVKKEKIKANNAAQAKAKAAEKKAALLAKISDPVSALSEEDSLHAKRSAMILKLKTIATEKQNKEMLGKILTLEDSENKRHELRTGLIKEKLSSKG